MLFDVTTTIALSALLGLVITAAALLHAWQGWLSLKQSELAGHGPSHPDTGSAIGAARIEIADLKERIRKLEAIASGVDL